MTTDNKGAMTAEQKARVQYFVDAFEMNGVGDTVATVQDSPGTHVAITVADLRALLAAQPVQAAPEAVDEDAAFKQWMIWHHDYDLCLTNERRKSARAGWDARARLGVIAPVPDQSSHDLRSMLATLIDVYDDGQNGAWKEHLDEAWKTALDEARAALSGIAPVPAEGATFQRRVQPWLMECFGPMIASDREERNHRFLEEALELVQACGCNASEAHQLVDYVFGRPVGEPRQEVGGVMVTLAALCLANGLDMHADGETELARISVPETVAKKPVQKGRSVRLKMFQQTREQASLRNAS